MPEGVTADVLIFNRTEHAVWSGQMGSSSDHGWTGTLPSGAKCEPGVYPWKANIAWTPTANAWRNAVVSWLWVSELNVDVSTVVSLAWPLPRHGWKMDGSGVNGLIRLLLGRVKLERRCSIRCPNNTSKPDLSRPPRLPVCKMTNAAPSQLGHQLVLAGGPAFFHHKICRPSGPLACCLRTWGPSGVLVLDGIGRP